MYKVFPRWKRAIVKFVRCFRVPPGRTLLVLALVMSANLLGPLFQVKLPLLDVTNVIGSSSTTSDDRIVSMATDIYYFHEQEYLKSSHSLIYLQTEVQIMYWGIRVTYGHGLINYLTNEIEKGAANFQSVVEKKLSFWQSLFAFRSSDTPNSELGSIYTTTVESLFDSQPIKTSSVLNFVLAQKIVRLVTLCFCLLAFAVSLTNIGEITAITSLLLNVFLVCCSISSMTLVARMETKIRLSNFGLYLATVICQILVLVMESIENLYSLRYSPECSPFHDKNEAVVEFSTIDWNNSDAEPESPRVSPKSVKIEKTDSVLSPEKQTENRSPLNVSPVRRTAPFSPRLVVSEQAPPPRKSSATERRLASVFTSDFEGFEDFYVDPPGQRISTMIENFSLDETPQGTGNSWSGKSAEINAKKKPSRFRRRVDDRGD